MDSTATRGVCHLGPPPHCSASPSEQGRFPLAELHPRWTWAAHVVRLSVIRHGHQWAANLRMAIVTLDSPSRRFGGRGDMFAGWVSCKPESSPGWILGQMWVAVLRPLSWAGHHSRDGQTTGQPPRPFRPPAKPASLASLGRSGRPASLLGSESLGSSWMST